MFRTVLLAAALLAAGPALALENACRVADPSGTPLNLRTTPYGRIIGVVENGTMVSVMDETRDRAGRVWVYVRDDYSTQPLGWVYRDYINCR